MPTDREVAFVALDEGQMGADRERGHVFTNRILSARGFAETMILGSETLRPMIRALLPDAEIITRPRFSTLSYSGSKKLSRLPRRAAIVAFSAEEVYARSEEHTSELQSLMRNSYAVFCLKKKQPKQKQN